MIKLPSAFLQSDINDINCQSYCCTLDQNDDDEIDSGIGIDEDDRTICCCFIFTRQPRASSTIPGILKSNKNDEDDIVQFDRKVTFQCKEK